MSKYTTQLRFIVEQALDDGKWPHEETYWDNAYDAVGLKDYPIFDEAYRETLNNKIIRHYYTREIGAESAGRFRMFVRDTMHLIMPYYNQMYESELVAKNIEPLSDTNYKRSEKAFGSSKSDSTAQNATQDVYSDTPQSEMIPDQIKAMKYATTVNLDEAQGTTSGTGSYENTVDRTEDGYGRPQAELLRVYRESFLNIDMEIVTHVELAQCFMNIW